MVPVSISHYIHFTINLRDVLEVFAGMMVGKWIWGRATR